MINYSRAGIKALSIHHVGNKTKEQNLLLSDAAVDLDLASRQELCAVYLSSFREDFFKYRFQVPEGTGSLQTGNKVYSLASNIITGTGDFHNLSAEIATLLYDRVNHPNIREGELHVCLFDGISLDGEEYSALGLFKVDSRSGFLKVEPVSGSYHVSLEQGVHAKDLDKGCLVIGREEEAGYEVYLLDAFRKTGSEAQYWKEEFLHVASENNSFSQTKEFVMMASNFISEGLPEALNAEAPEKAQWLNRSAEYLKSSPSVSVKDYGKNVFEDDEIVDSFMEYSRDYQGANNIMIEDEFQVEPKALKKYANQFRSVIKLDKNFHIYVHGNASLLEKGFDHASGKHFYKLLFDEES